MGTHELGQQKKLLDIKAIKYNSHFYIKTDNLWLAFHSFFNMAQDYQIDIRVPDEIFDKVSMLWVPFSKVKFMSSINKCNNLLSPGPDKLIWRHLKCIVKNNMYLKKIINIADVCFELCHWPLHFKVSTSIIIPKPNKELYNFPKAFRPIVLLNTIGKLIEKVISNRLQFQLIFNNFIHSSQLDGLKQQLTSNTSIALTHFIYTR